MRARLERRWLPNLARSMDEVDRQLRDVFGQLARGQLPWPLLLFGEPGTGKTFAALCLLDGIDVPTCRWELPELCGQLVRAMKGEAWHDGATGGRISERETWNGWDRATLAVLDEIGTRQQVSDHHYETLKKALDLRAHRPLILISNLDPDGIASVYDARIASRCCCGTALELRGPDRRLAR